MTEIYLARWRWDTSDPLAPFWAAPIPGAIGCLDLRSIPEMALAGGVPQGWACFTYPAPVVIPGALNLGSDPNLPLTLADKGIVRIRLGIPRPIVADSVTDILWEALTLQADPTGLLRCKPLMPNIQGTLELYLGGFSLLRAKTFSFSEPEGPGVLAVLQEDYRRIRQERLGTPFADTHKRILGALVNRFGGDHRQFIPLDLPDEGMLEPRTTATDNFNRADQTPMGDSSEGWSWTEVLGAYRIQINVSRPTLVVQNGEARAETDLSSSDHETQVEAADAGLAALLGPMTRFAAAANTGYWGCHRNLTTFTYNAYKIVTGTATNLSQVDTTAPGTGFLTDKMSSNGSTQEFTSGGTVRNSITDTAITGNLRGGFRTQTTGHNIDDFNTEDLQQSVGYPTQMHNRRRGPRGKGRGLGRGQGLRVPA